MAVCVASLIPVAVIGEVSGKGELAPILLSPRALWPSQGVAK